MPVGTSFPSVEQVLRAKGSFRIVLEIQKDDGTWLDLSARVSQDRLVSMSGISGRTERGIGTQEVTLSSVVLDNSDSFWDGPPPSGIGSLYRKQARIGVRTVETLDPTYLCTMLVDGIDTDSSSANATLKFVSLSKRLSDKQADRVRDGKAWFVNRPTGWLVQQLLQAEFRRDEVQAWSAAGLIQNAYRIPVSDGVRALSHYGTPPEWDGQVWQTPPTGWYGNAICSISDSGSAHDGKVLFGFDVDLWLWDPAKDLWTKVGSATKIIRHLYWNALRHHAVGVCWDTDKPTTGVKAAIGGHAGNNSVRFFRALKVADGGGVVTYSASLPTGIVTGHWQVRVGGYNAGGNYTGLGGSDTTTGSSGDVACFGANLCSPFPYWQRWRLAVNAGTPPLRASLTQAPAWNDRQHDNGTPVASPNARLNGARWGQEQPGYYAYSATYEEGNGDKRPMDVRLHVGAWKGAFAMQNAGDLLVFFVISYDSTNKRYDTKFRIFNTNADTVTDPNAHVWDESGYDHQVNHAIWNPADTEVWYAASQFTEGQWSSGAPPEVAAYGVIAKATVSSSAVTSPVRKWWNAAYSSGVPEYRLLPVEIAFGASGSWIASTFFDYTKIGGQAFSVAMLDTTQSITSQMNMRRVSAGQPRGLVYDPVVGRIYWLEAGTGVLLSYPAGTNTIQASLEDLGNEAVAGDPNLLAGLVYDALRGALYGVSGQGISAESDLDTQASVLPGKYVLWQFAKTFTDRIELADFSDMTIWDALVALASVGDFLLGFDEQGRFFFRPRTDFTAASLFDPSTTARIVVRGPVNSDQQFLFSSLKKNQGFSDVYNMAEITPSQAILGEISITAKLVPRIFTPAPTVDLLWSKRGGGPVNRDPWSGDIQAFQQSLAARNIYLRCRQGSTPSLPDDGTMGKDLNANVAVDFSPGAGQRLHRLRFAVLLYDRMVETQAVAPINSSDISVQVPIEHVVDINLQQVLGTVNRGDILRIADKIERVIVGITKNATTGTATVTLDSTVGAAFPVGTKCVIRALENARWSDAEGGLCELIASSAPGSAGAQQYMQLSDTRNFSRGMILRLVDNLGVEECRVLSADPLDASRILVIRGVGGTAQYDHNSASPKTVAHALWAPIENADWPQGTAFTVGGTGVQLRVNLPPVEAPWLVGDEIEIVCPGLMLEPQEGAKAVSFNQDSIEGLKFGKLPWPTVRETRFLNYRQAIEVARRIVKENGLPRFNIVADGPFCMIPTQGRPVLVVDPRGVFPLPKSSSGLPVATASPNGQDPVLAPDTTDGIAMYVRGFTVNPYNDNLSLDLRAVNPHAGSSVVVTTDVTGIEEYLFS